MVLAKSLFLRLEKKSYCNLEGDVRIYKSEVDYRIYNFVMFITLLSIAPILFIDDFSIVLYVVLGMVAASLWLIHTVFHGVRYMINLEQETLTVKIGFFTYGTYAISEMKSIRRSNTWLSSPAASMDRIAIKIKFTPLVISPQHRPEFIKDLLSINPELEVQKELFELTISSNK